MLKEEIIKYSRKINIDGIGFTDYHVVLRNKMNSRVNFIKKFKPTLKYKKIVDTSFLCNRLIGYQAGLGFFGKNNLLINKKYNSYIFLGSILTNLEIEINKPNP